jgi:hypothetical protein
MKQTEDQLCEIFAQGLKEKPEFSARLLRPTRLLLPPFETLASQAPQDEGDGMHRRMSAKSQRQIKGI